MKKLLMFIALLVASVASATDYCDGFERGYRAVKGDLGFVPVCTYMPFESNRPKSDYEFGYLKGVERAKKDANQNQPMSPPVANNRPKDCDCGKLSAIQSAQSIFGPSMRDIEEERKNRKLNDLRRKAETEALNAQIRQTKATGFEPKPKLTKSLKKKHDEQLKELNNEARNVKALIAKLGSGGNQETRQKNYDVAIAAFSAYVKNAEQFFDDWTDPKYRN